MNHIITRSFRLIPTGQNLAGFALIALQALPKVGYLQFKYLFRMRKSEQDDPEAVRNDGKEQAVHVWAHTVGPQHPELADESMLGESWVFHGLVDDAGGDERTPVLIYYHSKTGEGIITFNPDPENPVNQDDLKD